LHILIVDDTYSVSETIADYLELEGMSVDFAYHGEAALQLVADNHYDVIIMDIMMPKMDGITAVKKLREELFCNTPIIFLTAKDQLADKVASFNAGGDDYLIKPFALEELSMRIFALARRGVRQDIGLLTFADISVDVKSGDVRCNNQLIKVSPIQLTILKVLMKKAPNIVTRQEVNQAVWGDEPPSSDALRSHIYSLRTKLASGQQHSRLETIHGQGFKLKS